MQSLRLKGVSISSFIINAIAKGILNANDRTLLVENGGHLSFSDSLTRNICNEMERNGKKMHGNNTQDFPWHQLGLKKKNSRFNGTS